jgi:hypothetical protein
MNKRELILEAIKSFSNKQMNLSSEYASIIITDKIMENLSKVTCECNECTCHECDCTSCECC